MGGRKAVESFYNWDRVTSEMVRIGNASRSTRLEVAQR
jgi:hypothetical protein